MIETQSPYLNTEEAARYLHLKPSTMEAYRVRGGGPQFCRAGGRRILYRVDALNSWADARTFSSTSEMDAA